MAQSIIIVILFLFLLARTVMLENRINRIENSIYPALRNRKK